MILICKKLLGSLSKLFIFNCLANVRKIFHSIMIYHGTNIKNL